MLGCRQVHAIVETGDAAGLRRLCCALAEELGFRGASVTVMTPDGLDAATASSDDDIGKLKELQFVLGEGPTGDSYASGRPVLVSDLTDTGGRWVAFAAAASAQQIGAVYAFPLQLGAVRLGALTCYSSVPRRLESHAVARCLTIAESARDLLLDAVAEGGPGGIQQSLQIRREVYQVQGMLMVELDVSLADALVRLRAMAYSEGLDINELAADLVSKRRPMPARIDGA